ncbi:MAG: divergent polysaccharide deacetylase family protein [Rhodospirillales bacterium]|nr:divergent polysaccharide deacetylase family protein [Rhodospirillales bacterium]
MKFPKLFGRKSSDDDYDDDEDYDGDEDDSAAEGDDEPSGDDDDEDYDDEDYDEDDEDGSGGGNKRILLLAIGGASLALILIVGGAAWWFLGGSEGEHAEGTQTEKGAAEETVAEVKESEQKPGHVVLNLSPRPRPNQGKLKPQPGQKLSATDTLNAIAAISEGPGAGIVVTPVQAAAFSNFPTPPAAQPLPPTPDAALVEQSPQGPLPIIGKDGRKPWQVYARPFKADDPRPRIAVVFFGLGMNRSVTNAAIKYLPPEVTLAFNPYAAGLHDWASAARKAGHEVLVGVPMEPKAFPAQDPGPSALMTKAPENENLARLEYLLSRQSGYVGVMSLMGSRFTQEEEHMRPVLELLNSRGLMFVDSMTGRETVGPTIAKEIGLPRAVVNMKFEEGISRAALGRQLADLERVARISKSAMIIARPYPATIAGISEWAGTLAGKKIALAPVSAIADRQSVK